MRENDKFLAASDLALREDVLAQHAARAGRQFGTVAPGLVQHGFMRKPWFRPSRLRAVALAIGQPDDVDVNEILFRPTRREL